MIGLYIIGGFVLLGIIEGIGQGLSVPIRWQKPKKH